MNTVSEKPCIGLPTCTSCSDHPPAKNNGRELLLSPSQARVSLPPPVESAGVVIPSPAPRLTTY
ncbi:hypothetical protein JMJ77_0001743, partial [Colletotrichum scovillei]